nr:MAG TPA: TRAF PROTEIN, TRAO PROTEIN, TRAN ADHESION, BACTERIAL SECRETION.5A [Caudoviricetes sp.]
MKRYIIIFLAAVALISGCSQTPEPDPFRDSIYWIN